MEELEVDVDVPEEATVPLVVVVVPVEEAVDVRSVEAVVTGEFYFLV